MNDDDFARRVLTIARAAGNGIKPLSAKYICDELRKALDDDAAAAAIRHDLRKLRAALPTHFEPLEAVEESQS